MFTLVAAICLLPVSGFASTAVSFTLSGFSAASNPVYSGTVLTIDYNDLTSTAGTCTTGCAGTYVETYNNTTGVFSLTQTGGAGISLTINEAAGLVNTSGAAFSLYSAPTSLTFNSALLSEIGLGSNPPVQAFPVALQSVSAAIQSSNDKVTSAVTQFTATPEPSTFAMLGMALLCGIGFTVRKRSLANSSR